MYLMIQNPGVAPHEGFLILGVSTTRNCGVEDTIGQFGSGTKHAINVLLRANLKVFVYCGKTKLEFTTRESEVDDGLTRKRIERVMCKMGGTSTRTVDLGWVLDFGSMDWTETAMALREFISNAIDRTLREEGDFIPAKEDGRLVVGMVTDTQVKARDGYTRVFIECNHDVAKYMNELPKRFLHFSDKPEQVRQSMLPKADRNFGKRQVPVIYRAGVFVREIQESEDTSVYDYNFKTHELKIDECRNSSDYETRAAISRLYRRASVSELVPFMRALTEEKPVYEERLDPYYVIPSWDTPKDEQKANWQNAWQIVAGDAVMCSPTTAMVDMVERKGYNATLVRTIALTNIARLFGVKIDLDVLSESEQKGREKLPATPAAQEAVDTVWQWFQATGLTNGYDKPTVGCFRSILNGGTRLLGFCDTDGVYLEEAHASGITKMVLQTALEECTHWVTKSTDNSRDFQDFLLQLVIEMAS